MIFIILLYYKGRPGLVETRSFLSGLYMRKRGDL